MKLINDYKNAVELEGHDLLAVEMSDGGWSIADGFGVLLTPDDEIELSGWHLPVRFVSKDQALKAIESGTASIKSIFDISAECEWVKHGMSCGAVFEETYLM